MKIDLISYEQSKSKMKAVGKTETGGIAVMEYKGKNGIFNYCKPYRVLTADGKLIKDFQIYVNGKKA